MDEQGELFKKKQQEQFKVTHEQLQIERSEDYLETPPEQFRQQQQAQQPEETFFPATTRMEIENRLQHPMKDQKARRAFDAAQDQVFTKNTTLFYDGSARREINKQIQKNKDLHSERLQETITLARRLTGQEPVTMNSLTYLPSATVLHSEYKAKDLKLTAKKRAEKFENKKSRLYQKRVLAGTFMQAEANNIAAGLQMLEQAVNKDQVLGTDQEIMDLAAFMTTDKATNERMVKAFFGTGGDPNTMNREGVLDGMAQMLFTINIGGLRLDNDQEMAKNAPMLEMVVRQVDAFDRLAKENNYLEGLNSKMRADVELKLSQLRSIAFYYNARKEIISDPYYMSHYNEELTMDITKEPTAAERKNPEELEKRREMSKKLLKAYVAGRVMMEKNGVDSDLIRKMGVPKFADKAAGEQFINDYREVLQREDVQKNALAESYQTTMKQQWALDQMSSVRRKTADPAFRDALVLTAQRNATEFQGEEYLKPGYKDPEVTEQRMKEYIQELDSIQVSQISYGSAASIVKDYYKNHEICARVRFLHKQISRGIASGFPVDDKQLIAIRAKTNAFCIMDAVSSTINYELIQDKTKASFSNEQWKAYLNASMDKGLEDSIKLFAGSLYGAIGDPMALLKNCEKYAKEEDAKKDETINAVWQYLGKGKFGEKIPSEELKRMRAEYNRSAVLDDFFHNYNFLAIGGNSPSSLMTAYLRVQEKEKAKQENRNPRTYKYERTHYNLVKGISAAEQQRYHDLSLSESLKDRADYYTEMIEIGKRFSFDELDVGNMPKLLENFEQKQRSLFMQFDNLAKAAGEVDIAVTQFRSLSKEEQAKYNEEPDLPEEYVDSSEMIRDCTILHNFSCGYLAGRVNGLAQTPNTRYNHVLSLKERLNMSDEDIQKNDEREEYIGGRNLKKEEETEYNVITTMTNKYKNFLNALDDEIPGHHFSVGGESLDYLYRKERRKYDEKTKYWEEKGAFFHEWDDIGEDFFKKEAEHQKEMAGDINAVMNYYQERIWKTLEKNGLAGNSERRWACAITETMTYLGEHENGTLSVNPERMLKAMCTTSKDLKADEALHREKNELLDQVMDVILNFDMKQLNFSDYHDFLKYSQVKNAMIVHMAWDLRDDTSLKSYMEDLSGDNAEEFCGHTKQQVREVLIRKNFLQEFVDYYQVLVPFMSTEKAKKVDMFDLLGKNYEMATQELQEHLEAGDIENSEFARLLGVLTNNNYGIEPGNDMNVVFKAYREKILNDKNYKLQ